MNPFEISLQRYFTEKNLLLIRQVKVGIAGCGGLGSNAANVLARCGFKNFEILDKDTIDASNLNRQLFFIDEIGQPKAQTLKNRLLAINPNIKIATHHCEWNITSASNFFTNCDFLMECFDQAQFKHDIVDFYHDKVKAVISGNGIAGIGIEHKLKIRQRGNIYMVGDGESAIEDGYSPLAPSVIACAAKMAEIILELTLKS